MTVRYDQRCGLQSLRVVAFPFEVALLAVTYLFLGSHSPP